MSGIVYCPECDTYAAVGAVMVTGHRDNPTAFCPYCKSMEITSEKTQWKVLHPALGVESD